MEFLWILIPIGVLALTVLLIAYICYRMAFYAPNRPNADPDFIDLPQGEVYEPFHAAMTRWTKEVRAMPHTELSITSFDGLTLC